MSQPTVNGLKLFDMVLCYFTCDKSPSMMAPNIFEFHVNTNLNKFSVCEHNPITNRTALLLWQISVQKLEVIIYHLSQPLDTINNPSLEMDHCHEMEFPDHYTRSKFIAFSNGMLQPLNFCKFQPQHRELDYQTARGGNRLSD